MQICEKLIKNCIKEHNKLFIFCDDQSDHHIGWSAHMAITTAKIAKIKSLEFISLYYFDKKVMKRKFLWCCRL